MFDATVVDNSTSRDLLRTLRRQPDQRSDTCDVLPESVLWQTWCELRRRGDETGDSYFLSSMWQLHRRRSLGGSLPCRDPDPEEHKLAHDPFLGELWKAYKRCICSQRTGPAAQLLRDIEKQISAA